MVRPTEITALRTSNWLEFSCDNCNDAGVFNSNETIEIDIEGQPTTPLLYNCRSCGLPL